MYAQEEGVGTGQGGLACPPHGVTDEAHGDGEVVGIEGGEGAVEESGGGDEDSGVVTVITPGEPLDVMELEAEEEEEDGKALTAQSLLSFYGKEPPTSKNLHHHHNHHCHHHHHHQPHRVLPHPPGRG